MRRETNNANDVDTFAMLKYGRNAKKKKKKKKKKYVVL